MQTYLDGSELVLEIPVVDGSGTPVVAESVFYTITDGNGNELLAETEVSGFSGDESISIEIDSAINTMADIGDVDSSDAVIEVREARNVILRMVTEAGTVISSFVYGLERAEKLIAGVNSFQSYAQSLVNAMEISDKLGWDGATEDERIRALIEAKNRLSQMTFRIDTSDMSRLSYRKTIGEYTPSLDEMGKADYENLPAKFRKALSMAQIAEANYILNGDEIEEMKSSGVITSKVGETWLTLKEGKSLEFPVCKRALGYLQRYVILNARIARG